MKKLIMFLISAVLLTACGTQKPADTSNTTEETNKPTVVTTFYPVYEFTKQLIGDEADVQMLIPAGTEPHDFEPSSKEIASIQDSSVFVYLDDNMETWVKSALESTQKNPEQVIMASTGIELLPGTEDEHEHEEEQEAAEVEEHEEDHEHEAHEFDPHLWLSPKRAIQLVENIKAGLIKNFPDKQEIIEKNAQNYLAQLTELDNEYTASLSQAKQKYFVTQHTAFAYLAKDYGLTQVSITGISADTDPTIKRLQELSEYINKYQIKYIYFEENAKQSVAQTLANETGAQLEVLNPIESLTKEQMDAGENYISIMKTNLSALEKTTTQEGVEILPENN